MPNAPGIRGATAFELTGVLIVLFIICFVYEIAFVISESREFKSVFQNKACETSAFDITDSPAP
jgi:hypothetical protein